MNATISLHIMVIEDNDGLREATVDKLQTHGHRVEGVFCAEAVDDTPVSDVPDLYVIDVNLPGEDGFSLSQRIRRSQPRAGIVLMTARGELNDRLAGYSTGADHYLIKPVDPAELLVCIQSLARRIQADGGHHPADQLILHKSSLLLEGPGGKAGLSNIESLILAALSRAPGRLLERWQIMQLIDPDDKGLVQANSEVRISSLRKKLTACGAPQASIRSVRGIGYALNCSVQVI